MLFRLRIEASLPSYDDAAQIARFAALNGQTFEAATYDEATAHLRGLGLDAGHGIGIDPSGWAYPTAADQGTKVWHLTGRDSRRRLGNNAKVQLLRRR